MDRTDAADRMVQSALTVSEDRRGNRDQFYNDRSRLIVLDGPRGELLARLMGAAEPDPDRHRFLTSFQPQHPTFEGPRPPSEAPPDVTAYAHPIESRRDPREQVASGASGDPLGNRAGGEEQKMITPTSGTDRTMLDLEGIDMRPGRIDVHSAGSGMTINEDGITVRGGFEQSATRKKGATKESPIDGVVPETAISFPFSGYLPNTQMILRIKSYFQLIRNAPRLIRSILRAADELT